VACLAIAAACVAAACEAPETDIVATSTEAVGNFSLSGAVQGNAYEGRVCVDEPGHADEIARRIVQQLANHQFSTVTLDVYSPDGPVARFASGRNGFTRAGAPAAPDACAQRGDR
jgi:hypothetical protein